MHTQHTRTSLPFTHSSATGVKTKVKRSWPARINEGQEVREKSKPGTSSSPIFALAPTQDPRDRKFNLLVFGLKESIKGTPKHTRDQKDHSDVCDILSLVEPSVTSNSIRDFFRLGKFNEDKVRPILVKFIRAHEVASVLANRKLLASMPGISIKPDLPPEERRVQSLLLKERRSLINSGVDRTVIKIIGNSLLAITCQQGQTWVCG